mmetsp:Transcript_58557/g.174359  ORF Transcript_58557/g.174359 Transcript_58557/m.174359 type:complete len:281 (+) Transcript_58557:2115-2957(+)
MESVPSVGGSVASPPSCFDSSLRSTISSVPFRTASAHTSSTPASAVAALAATLARAISPLTAATSAATAWLAAGMIVSRRRQVWRFTAASTPWKAASASRFRARVASATSRAARARARWDCATRRERSSPDPSWRARREDFSCRSVSTVERKLPTVFWNSSSRRRCILIASSKFLSAASLASKSLSNCLLSSAWTSSISAATSAASSISLAVALSAALSSSRPMTRSERSSTIPSYAAFWSTISFRSFTSSSRVFLVDLKSCISFDLDAAVSASRWADRS